MVVTFTSINITIHMTLPFLCAGKCLLTVFLELQKDHDLLLPTSVAYVPVPKLILAYHYEASRSWIQLTPGRESDRRWPALCKVSGTKTEESADLTQNV